MSSYSSPLPPLVTPGWNDPPDLSGERKKITNRLVSIKHRRPVDPSIQGFERYQASAHLNQWMAESPSPPSVLNSSAPNQHLPVEVQQFGEQHRTVYDAFTVASASYQHPYDFAQVRPAGEQVTQPSFYNNASLPIQQNFADNSLNSYPQTFPPPVTAASYVHPALITPMESDPKALIYTPPNVVDENMKSLTVAPNPAGYIAPVKAAGDVSLTGVQLVSFLTKATLRLPPGVTRDGIQLRIGQFHELVSMNRISESCIKKLNFVIDAIDRGYYDEALQFFEQLQSLFPEETKSSWSPGVRLLIMELRRPPRIGSAGAVRHY